MGTGIYGITAGGNRMGMETLRQQVLERLDHTKEATDEEIYDCIDEVLIQESKKTYLPLKTRISLRKSVFDSLRRMDVLQDLLENPEITEIMVNGYDTIFIEEQGRIRKLEAQFLSKERLSDVIQQIVARTNRRINEASPIVDSRLEDGSRVNIVLNPIAINGPILTIRKFPEHPITMQDLIGWGALNEELAELFADLVSAGYNIFVCGGTGSGKTTFLNAISNFIQKERVITIEDSAELRLSSVENLVRLETRNKNVEGENEITIRDLIRSSLRMRPDRIIVGEVRGEEALDLLQAMNTGHDGSLSTGHGNSPQDMLSRLEIMVLMGVEMPISAIRAQIASAIDILIFLGRLRDRSRKVLEVVELTGYENGEIQTHTLYQFVETGQEKGRIQGEWRGSKERLKMRKKLLAAGICWEK